VEAEEPACVGWSDSYAPQAVDREEAQVVITFVFGTPSAQGSSITEKRVGYSCTLPRRQQLRDGQHHLSGNQLRYVELAAVLTFRLPTGNRACSPHTTFDLNGRRVAAVAVNIRDGKILSRTRSRVSLERQAARSAIRRESVLPTTVQKPFGRRRASPAIQRPGRRNGPKAGRR
jgi:hypothetical protein